MLRVLHIITRLELGGAQKNTLHTVGHLDRSSFEVALAWGPGDILDGEARALGDVALHEIQHLVRPLAPLKDLTSFRQLRKVIRDFRPDIVHTHSSKAGILGRLAARFEGVPVVVHSIHGWGFTPLQSAAKRALFLSAERRAAPWTTHFIAVSHANRIRGEELGICPPEAVSVIRSGIDLGRFVTLPDPAPLRLRLGLPHDAMVVTQIGNFKPQKAPLDFVKAAARVAETCPEIHFVMVGDGVMRPAIEALVKNLGLSDRFCLPGWIDDVAEVLSLTDVAILSSRHEGLPRTVVEALAAGVPVVATDVDGTSEVLRDGVNGFLVRPGAVEDMADRMSRLIQDKELRERLARAAPEGLADFDIDLMVRQQEELYECLSCRKN